MTWLEAFILGLLQAFTEFLPVSSSGHLELGKVLFEIQNADDTTFAVVVHAATALSTVVVFRRDIAGLFSALLGRGTFDQRRYVLFLVVSAVPVGLVGLFLKDEVDALFTGNLVLVGSMLLVTTGLLLLTRFAPKGEGRIGWGAAVCIGAAQAVAVFPGISRSGATLGTALLFGIEREQAARFAFLMAVAPILGAGLLEAKDLFKAPDAVALGVTPLAVGFVTAFVGGLIACSWMLRLVRFGHLYRFSFYTLAVGLAALAVGLSG